jgi:hypothetical protein
MGWQDLICAACSGRVVDGRCARCRAARDEFQAQRTLPAGPLLLLAAVLLTLLVLL